MWGDEGFVVRFPEVERPPDPALLLPEPEEIEGLVLRQLGSTSLFAARFRETAARALLLPRRRPGMRTPLWQQRKRASDLLAVASRFGSFPALLETYREVLRDHFDMPALVDILRRVSKRTTSGRDDRLDDPVAVRGLAALQLCRQLHLRRRCSARRTAGAGALGRSGSAPGAAWRRRTARTARPGGARHRRTAAPAPRREPPGQDRRTAFTICCLRIGDLTREEIEARCSMPTPPRRDRWSSSGRDESSRSQIAGERRYVAVEDAARYRDALGTPLPAGLPAGAARARSRSGRGSRAAVRPHARPFTVDALAQRFGLGTAIADSLLARLTESGRVVQGEFRPGGVDREWVDADVLRRLRSRSLARLRREVEPVSPDALGRFLVSWHGIGSRAARARSAARRRRATSGRASALLDPRARRPARAGRWLPARRCSTR